MLVKYYNEGNKSELQCNKEFCFNYDDFNIEQAIKIQWGTKQNGKYTKIRK